MLRAGDKGYAEEVAAFNSRRQHTPDVVVVPRRRDDVAAAVRSAVSGVPRRRPGDRARGGPPDRRGPVISTRGLDEVTIDPERRTARVGAGVKWRRVSRRGRRTGSPGCAGRPPTSACRLHARRRAAAAGARVRLQLRPRPQLDVVTGDGSAHHVESGDGSELDWALRGGKGTSGSCTRWRSSCSTSRTVRRRIFWPGALAPTLLHGFAEWAETLPDEFRPSIGLLRLPPLPEVPEPLRGQLSVHLRVATSATTPTANGWWPRCVRSLRR